MRGRLADLCNWFAIDPPRIKTQRGKVILSNDLMTWCEAEAVSLDYVLLGDARPMAATVRRLNLAARKTKAEAGR